MVIGMASIRRRWRSRPVPLFTGSGFSDDLENLARDEAFEAADDLALGLAFRCASRNVVDGTCVTGGHPHEHDAMDRGVGGAVTAPGEPVPLMLTRRDGDGCSSAQCGELLLSRSGLSPQATRSWPATRGPTPGSCNRAGLTWAASSPSRESMPSMSDVCC